MHYCRHNNQTRGKEEGRDDDDSTMTFLLEDVSEELECLRLNDTNIQAKTVTAEDGMAFPRNCQQFLRSIKGNTHCVDCGCSNPDWASITYGVLLCTRCSGRHRSYGVATSRVRSITLDKWSHRQVLAMLEGGNDQLQTFYDRHELGRTSPSSSNSSSSSQQHSTTTTTSATLFHQRYHTKAAKFYKHHLDLHIQKLQHLRHWQGRAASRSPSQSSQSQGRGAPTKSAAKTVTATTTTTTTTTTTNKYHHRYNTSPSSSLQQQQQPVVMVNSAA